MKTMLKKTWTLLILCAVFAMTTGCIVITEGDGHHDDWGDHHGWSDDCEDGEDCWKDWDGWDDWDDDDRVDMGDSDPVGSGDCDMPDSTEVCGEDGVTYLTPCDASRAKTRVAHDGACGPACAASAECGIYETCGDFGRCEPMSCTEEYVPVCGVDGITYSNACDAEAHHVAVDYTGECAPACTVDSDCAMGDLCESGRCEPANCPVLAADDHSVEVCGEDDFTYQSECHARLARQGVKHQGCCI